MILEIVEKTSLAFRIFLNLCDFTILIWKESDYMWVYMCIWLFKGIGYFLFHIHSSYIITSAWDTILSDGIDHQSLNSCVRFTKGFKWRLINIGEQMFSPNSSDGGSISHIEIYCFHNKFGIIMLFYFTLSMRDRLKMSKSIPALKG